MTGSDAGAPDQAAKPTKASGSETTTEAVLPKDILDKKDLEKNKQRLIVQGELVETRS